MKAVMAWTAEFPDRLGKPHSLITASEKKRKMNASTAALEGMRCVDVLLDLKQILC